MKKKEFEYYTKNNAEEIYIEDRGGRINRYAVYNNQSCVCDCLNKKEALNLANEELNNEHKTTAK